MDFNRDEGNAIISKIQLNIQTLNQHVQQLESQLDRLSDSSTTGERVREQFNELAQSSNLLSKETNTLMQQLVKICNVDRSLRVHRERLVNEYMGVLKRLQFTQRHAADVEKNSMKNVREAVEQDAERRRREEFEANPFADHQQQMQQQINISEIKERSRALQQLNQDISDVNQIFADLARIVHEQQDLVDSIEANVEHASIHVEQGHRDVQQAVYYQAKARQKKLFLCIFLVILVSILLLTVYFVVKN